MESEILESMDLVWFVLCRSYIAPESECGKACIFTKLGNGGTDQNTT